MKTPLLLALMALASGAALADSSPSTPVVHLEASATKAVPQDAVEVALYAERDGVDAARVQQQVTEMLAHALSLAKGKTGLTVHNGHYQTTPTYGKEGRISAWRAHGELILEGSSAGAVTGVVAELSDSLSIGHLSFKLAPEAEKQAQAQLQGEAVAAFLSKAREATRQLGFREFELGELQVETRGAGPTPAFAMMRASTAAMPLAGGEAQVSVSVSGTIRLKP